MTSLFRTFLSNHCQPPASRLTHECLPRSRAQAGKTWTAPTQLTNKSGTSTKTLGTQPRSSNPTLSPRASIPGTFRPTSIFTVMYQPSSANAQGSASSTQPAPWIYINGYPGIGKLTIAKELWQVLVLLSRRNTDSSTNSS
jgi:hypothetical protein